MDCSTVYKELLDSFMPFPPFPNTLKLQFGAKDLRGCLLILATMLSPLCVVTVVHVYQAATCYGNIEHMNGTIQNLNKPEPSCPGACDLVHIRTIIRTQSRS